MIFPDEVQACVDGVATEDQQLNAIEHHELGGFHCNVLTTSREAFNEWLASRESFGNTGQQDLLEKAS